MTENTGDYRPDLIFDVGMHTGEDTSFYLRKGFRVVGVEANPDLCASAKERFRDYIQAGRLTIVPKAVNARSGLVTLWVNKKNDEWSSLSREYVARNERISAHSTPMRVQAVRFAELLREHGIPYYLKIDIEGLDHLCVQALCEFSSRPRFVSVETSGTNDFDYTFGLLQSLYDLGYRQFKLVNQYMNHRVALPDPPKEGNYVAHRFPRDASSGPFGEETPGSWEPFGSIIDRYRKLLRLQVRYTVQGRHFNPLVSFAYYKLHRLLGTEPVGWYDIHAKFDESAQAGP